MEPDYIDKAIAIRMIRPDISPTQAPQILIICQDELDKLFTDRGPRALLKSQMEKRVKFFYDHPQNFFQSNEFFKFFTQCDVNKKQIPVYVMRFNHMTLLGNLRIFLILHEGELLLLHAFQEKKKSDYAPAFETTKKRLKTLK